MGTLKEKIKQDKELTELVEAIIKESANGCCKCSSCEAINEMLCRIVR